MNMEKMNQQWLRLTSNESQNSREVTYATKMLQKREVEGLLPLRKRVIDGNTFYDYSILGLHTMHEAWEGRFLSEDDLSLLLQSLKQTLQQVKEFLLNPRRICVNPSYVMYDTVKRKWNFLYIIVPYESQQSDIKELLDFFVSKLGGMGTADKVIYEYLSDCLQFEEGLSLEELISIWDGRKKQIVPEDVVEEEQRLLKPENEALANQDDAPSEVVCTYTWKERWNKAIYGKLYLVPFCPH